MTFLRWIARELVAAWRDLTGPKTADDVVERTI